MIEDQELSRRIRAARAGECSADETAEGRMGQALVVCVALVLAAVVAAGVVLWRVFT